MPPTTYAPLDVPRGWEFPHPVRIYTGLLGQIGDIIMFSATLRHLRQRFPAGQINLRL